jgi:hypothetical protein
MRRRWGNVGVGVEVESGMAIGWGRGFEWETIYAKTDGKWRDKRESSEN